ncbi:MAG TPA: helix-turn-helix domain-containing protein [Acidimicrobiales bacterium]|nr:helix-turn-helix domain-containing protein [Acidimicrobiales bacterium]
MGGRGTAALPQADGDDRNRQERGARRRQQILDAAVELFASKGYRGTGLAALADRVQMTPTGLLYYFGTKERLLREVVAERDRADHVDVPDEWTLENLRYLGRHNVDTALLTRLYAVLGAESLDADEPLHDYFVDRYEMARAFTRDILRSDIEAGRVRGDVDVEQVALEVISTLIGMESQWLSDPVEVDMATSIDAYFARLAAQLAPPSAG